MGRQPHDDDYGGALAMMTSWWRHRECDCDEFDAGGDTAKVVVWVV